MLTAWVVRSARGKARRAERWLELEGLGCVPGRGRIRGSGVGGRGVCALRFRDSGRNCERLNAGARRFDIWWRSAAALLEGENIYRNTGVPASSLNPPFWTILITPFVLFDPLTAYRLFVFLSVATVAGYLAWIAGELSLDARRTALGTAALLLSAPLISTLILGQVYPFLALSLAAAWVFDRRGHQIAAGLALGLAPAMKPLLVPVLLWPLARRRWGTLGAALASGAMATLLGVLIAGPVATFVEYPKVLSEVRLDGNPVNASLPGTAVRLFTDAELSVPVAYAPWTVPVALILGGVLVLLTAYAVRRDESGAGLWALVAVSLLASPVAWHNYLLLLGPGILLLLARGRVALALLLLALQFIPPQWSEPWRDEGTVVAALALTLYFYILVAHWLAFLTHGEEASKDLAAVPDRSVAVE